MNGKQADILLVMVIIIILAFASIDKAATATVIFFTILYGIAFIMNASSKKR